MIEQPAQFDFYDGGDSISRSSPSLKSMPGNVNVSRFGDRIIGPGGFINIAQNARCVVFSGTLTAVISISAGGWEDSDPQGGTAQEVRARLEQICYNAAMGRERGQRTLFVTERAVFLVGPQGLELIEIAPGVDVERDVLAHMGSVLRVP